MQYINGEDVKTGNIDTMSPPHDHQHIVGTYHKAEKKNITTAISGALEAISLWIKERYKFFEIDFRSGF